MIKIDLVKLRKHAGMSQRQLADLLQVRPSFLSAIENGRSRLPEEKLSRIKEIFEIDNLEPYMIHTESNTHVEPHTHTHLSDQSDSFTHLLTHFHDMAHRNSHTEFDNDSKERIEYLINRNDRLSDRLDELRLELDNLRKENYRLIELLVRNGINPF